MASIRRGYSDDFVIKNSGVGINTTEPQQNLDIKGVVKGQDLKVTGIASFTAYEGFLRADHQIAENTTLSFDQGPVSSLSGEIIVGSGVTVTIASVGLGTTMVGNGSGTIENTIDTTDVTRAGGSEIECLKVFNTFTPPNGGTNERPYAPKPGELYYNYDFKTIEFFDGYGWRQVDNTTRSGRGVIMGGDYTTPLGWSMEYVQIPTLGNSQYFGELEWGTYTGASFASSTRGLYAGGRGLDTYGVGSASYSTAHVDSITIASQGNSTSWGTMSTGFVHTDSCSNSTRGLVAKGYPDSTIVYYVTIATEGEYGTFGNLTVSKDSAAGCASPTRGIFSGGNDTPTSSFYNQIDVFTIASLGNAIEFGKLSRSRRSYLGSCSNNVRGIIMGGGVPNPIYFSDMEYITIATNGNGTDFGDLTLNRQNGTATATQTRGIYAGGGNPTYYNIIDYITLTSLGNAQDFGDLAVWGERKYAQSVSDSHGGI